MTTDLIARLRLMHKPRTERPGSCCIQCGIVWPCPTSKVLDEADAPVDRAAVLREAEQAVRMVASNCAYDSAAGCEFCNGVDAALERIRRLADKAQQPEAEAHPATRRWAAETYNPSADEWSPGMRYADRDRAVERLAQQTALAPLWADGEPVQRRLMRETTTYTVEAEGAQQPEHSCDNCDGIDPGSCINNQAEGAQR